MRYSPLLVLTLLLPACSSGGSTSSGGSGSGSPAAAAASQACRDTADAVAKAAQRCGQDYQTNYDAFIKGGANGNCANITAIRDEAALRATCLPSFATISCADLRPRRRKLRQAAAASHVDHAGARAGLACGRCT